MKKICLVGLCAVVVALFAGWVTVSISEASATVSINVPEFKQDIANMAQAGKQLLENAERLVEEVRTE